MLRLSASIAFRWPNGPLTRKAGRTCSVYGTSVVKQAKTFLATHRTFGGAIRVVIVQEKTGPQFFSCTDVNANPAEIIEAFAERATIEQALHDIKTARRQRGLG